MPGNTVFYELLEDTLSPDSKRILRDLSRQLLVAKRKLDEAKAEFRGHHKLLSLFGLGNLNSKVRNRKKNIKSQRIARLQFIRFNAQEVAV